MRSGANAIESYKQSKGGDGLRIREDLPRIFAHDHEALSAADKELLKWVGVFFRKPTPGEFMMRVRMAHGFTSGAQLRALADISRRLGNCVVDITTRQQIQLRGFVLGDVPEIWQRLRGVDLHSLQTGQDNVRNINGCALAGLTPGELFDASPVVFELDRMLVGRDGNPEFTNLPRKFNITVTGCRHNCTHAESQDVALVPATRFGRPGFNVLVGGKMGSGGFSIASPLDVFVEPGNAASIVVDLIRLFRDHGPRDARSRCRMAFLIEEWGVPRLRAELQRTADHDLEPAGIDARRRRHEDHLGVFLQKQRGFMSVGLSVPVGRLHPGHMDELARLAETYGSGQVRLTTSQNVIIPNVPDVAVEPLLEEPLLKELSPDPSPFRRRMVACTGTDFCNLAQIDTKSLAVDLAKSLEQRLGTACPSVSMNWSGCPAGCGNHQAADIGFRGLKARIGDELVDAVAIYVGGRTGPNAAAGQQLVEIARCDNQLPDLVANIVNNLEAVTRSVGSPADHGRSIASGIASLTRQAIPPRSPLSTD